MKVLMLAAFFAISARGAEAPAPVLPAQLTSGNYEVVFNGMLCKTCAKLVTLEVAGLKEVQKAAVDFEREQLFVTIRPGQSLSVSKLRKALKRAGKRADLGTQFEIRSILYKV